MRKLFVSAVLLVPVLAAASVLAAGSSGADTNETKVEKFLSDDEKALLAAILTHPEVSAEFESEAPLALKDPKNLGPFLGIWRAKVEAFAENEAKRGNPDLEGHYGSASELMTPEQRAFLKKRVPTMPEDKRNDLIEFLKKVDDALKEDGQLAWYTKKVVAGIMDEYRKELNEYAATPLAQTAKRDAASSASAFAAIRKTENEAQQAAAKPAAPAETGVAEAPAVKPVPPAKPSSTDKPAPTEKPATPPETPDSGGVAAAKPASGALDQARNTDAAGANGGQVLDGAGVSGRSSDPVIVPAGSGTARPPLPPSTAGSGSGLIGSIPEVPSPKTGAGDLDDILKMQTKPGRTTAATARKLKMAGGLLGGLLGALIGFFVGGPIGAIAGAMIGAGAGSLAAGIVTKRMLK